MATAEKTRIGSLKVNRCANCLHGEMLHRDNFKECHGLMCRCEKFRESITVSLCPDDPQHTNCTHLD